MMCFAKKVFIFLLSCILILGLIFFASMRFIGNQYEMGYQASILDKRSRLISINESKIILVGNSALAFGINSEMLEEAFGMPVVNLGLNGFMGNVFTEKIARLNINKGDVLIISHTTYSDNGGITDKELAWITLEYHKELWGTVGVKDIFGMVMAYPTYQTKAFLLKLENSGNLIECGTSYTRMAFNEYGDIVYRPTERTAKRENLFHEGSLKLPEINHVCIERLNDLNDYCEERGAQMVIAAFPIAMGEVSPDAEDYEEFEKELQNVMNCEVISDFKDYFYPYDWFYDTSYHLLSEAADVRTRQLIEDLRKWGL